MRNHYRHRNTWQSTAMCSSKQKNWLTHNGSLTARLKVRYADFAVQPVKVQFAKAYADEFSLVGLKINQHALIREVLLSGNGQPVVFAHSVLPRASLRGAWYKLGKLGNKPLGAALFANPMVKRTPLQYKKLPRQHPISMRVAEQLQMAPKALWARRSVFMLNCAKILVTEIFLPTLMK